MPLRLSVPNWASVRSSPETVVNVSRLPMQSVATRLHARSQGSMVSSRSKRELSVPSPGELQRLLAAIHSQQQSPGVNPQEVLHDLQRLIDSRSWEGATDDEGQPMTFRRALEEDWPTGVGLTPARRERLFALAAGYPECADMLADVIERIDELLPLRAHGTNQHSGVDIVNSKGGNDESYIRRRLRRDHPDLYEEV